MLQSPPNLAIHCHLPLRAERAMPRSCEDVTAADLKKVFRKAVATALAEPAADIKIVQATHRPSAIVSSRG